MGLWNKVLTKSLIGLVLGIMVGVFFWVISDATDRSNTELVIHLTASALLGLIAMGGSVVYEIESWGLLRATIAHYCLTMFDFIMASILLKWFPNISSMMVMLTIMTVIYAFIWLAESLYWKRTIESMNERLEECRSLEIKLQNTKSKAGI